MWRLQLSDVTDQGVFVQLRSTPPARGCLPRWTPGPPVHWSQDHEVDTSGPPRPLSDGYPFVYAYIEPAPTASTSSCRLESTAGEGADRSSSPSPNRGAILPDPVPRLIGRSATRPDDRTSRRRTPKPGAVASRPWSGRHDGCTDWVRRCSRRCRRSRSQPVRSTSARVSPTPTALPSSPTRPPRPSARDTTSTHPGWGSPHFSTRSRRTGRTSPG